MPTPRGGFTLIELLVVTLIIGILAALAIPKAASTKDKAKLASVKSDLHQIQVSEEAHYSGFAVYGTKSQLTTRTKFVPTVGNTWAISTTTAGFTATVTNASITKGFKKCTVTVGNPTSTGSFVCS